MLSVSQIIMEEFCLTILHIVASVYWDLFFIALSYHNSVLIRLSFGPGPLQHLDSLSVPQMASHLILAYFGTQKSSWLAQWLRSSGPVTAKWAKSSVTMLTVGQRCLCVFQQIWLCASWTNSSALSCLSKPSYRFVFCLDAHFFSSLLSKQIIFALTLCNCCKL